jgi:RNA polymerase sigma-70 factor (ECF subfamily)
MHFDARKASGMKNCTAPENRAARRVLPSACAAALVVPFTDSLPQTAQAGEVTPPTVSADIQAPAGNKAPSPGADAVLPQPDLVAAIPRLRRYARVLTGSATRADDLVQDTLVRAWDKRRLWKTGSDLRAWLFTIMHNVYVNQRALARREAGNISLECEGEHGAAWQVAERGNQFDRVALRELAQHVGRLPVEQREVLLLAAVEELRYDEIAAALAIPIGTVMSRLSRARETLRRMAI